MARQLTMTMTMTAELLSLLLVMVDGRNALRSTGDYKEARLNAEPGTQRPGNS